MGRKIIDLSLTVEDNMPAHKLFQSPIYIPALTHETTKSFGLGVKGDIMTFQTNYIGMLDHVGTHVDAFRHVNPKGKPIDEMPLDLFMGKAVTFDLTHIKDLEEITDKHMDEAEKRALNLKESITSNYSAKSMSHMHTNQYQTILSKAS